MRTTNVKRPAEFNQVCVWPATLVGKDAKGFEAFILRELHTRVKFLEEIVTTEGCGGEGGRHDVFFAVHNDDIGKFAVPRLFYGMRWVEDCIGNGWGEIWPERVKEYRTWDAGFGEDKEADDVGDDEEAA